MTPQKYTNKKYIFCNRKEKKKKTPPFFSKMQLGFEIEKLLETLLRMESKWNGNTIYYNETDVSSFSLVQVHGLCIHLLRLTFKFE